MLNLDMALKIQILKIFANVSNFSTYSLHSTPCTCTPEKRGLWLFKEYILYSFLLPQENSGLGRGGGGNGTQMLGYMHMHHSAA